MLNQGYTSPLEDIKTFFRHRSALSVLIVINAAVFLLVNIINLFVWLFQVDVLPITGGPSIPVHWLGVPAYLLSLLVKPWTIFTYMILQESFLHLFFNMVILYFGGRLFQHYIGQRNLVITYILGGLAGAALYIIAFNIFPVFEESLYFSVALGASASVLAILTAIATFMPDHTVTLFLFGRIKLKYIALILVVLDLLSIQQGNAGGHIAHLGGAFWGWLSIIIYKGSFSTFALPSFSGFSIFNKKKMRVSSNNTYKPPSRPATDEEYNKNRAMKQERIDVILEKISRNGYESLTKEEKELLFSVGNKN